ncbi:alpha-E domain-containing protein [uncultured Parasphingorhabdus sp.]|uniref:alpha-E domain-containing protein n=1 Tax=uncultured Parasphingorhabdus sp. TaxID=2709694 RepID=UPI0030DB4031|tara:strand:+ start:5417 stop:6367 length:951 start_codon:yes stop_codon:yes gene_type:complete
MLGKTAASLFWMARLLERTENSARLIEAGFRIALTHSSSSVDEWASILASSGAKKSYLAKHEDYSSAKVIDFLLRDKSNPGSVISLIKQARDSARTARIALTREVWEATNEAWMNLKTALASPVEERDLPDVLAVVRQQSSLVRGAVMGTMLRNDGFNFIRLGTFIERADSTARILDVKYYLLLPSIAQIGTAVDNVQWETILRSVSAQRSYRWLNGSDISALSVAEYLILHRQMPRSLAFCYAQISDNLGHLEREYGNEVTSHRLADDICDRLLGQPVQNIFEAGLHEFIIEFLAANNSLAAQIETDYNFQDRIS